MVNKCYYCNKDLIKTETAWLVCECEKAKKEWSIQMNIQGLQSSLLIAKKELSDLRESIKDKTSFKADMSSQKDSTISLNSTIG